jgi:NAD(P)-dependent dehydrogenase (short-subunit alcohol dehydrogenase family)
VITGGARGIGRATAQAFLRHGLEVCIGDRDGDAAEQTARELGGRAHAFTVDVTDRASYRASLDAVKAEVGPIDILVNNAGIMPLGPFLDERDEVSRATMDVNVWGPLYGMRLVLPDMLERRRGHVVNVASMAGKIPFAGMAVYNASKYAAVGLTAAVREETAGSGVSISAVLPTAVRTGLTEGIQLGGGLPTIEPEQVAKAIVRSCQTRRAEYPVPGWLFAAQPALAFVPERIVLTAKRLLKGDRAMKLEPGRRGDHERRVTEQAATRSVSKHRTEEVESA